MGLCNLTWVSLFALSSCFTKEENLLKRLLSASGTLESGHWLGRGCTFPSASWHHFGHGHHLSPSQNTLSAGVHHHQASNAKHVSPQLMKHNLNTKMLHFRGVQLVIGIVKQKGMQLLCVFWQVLAMLLRCASVSECSGFTNGTSACPGPRVLTGWLVQTDSSIRSIRLFIHRLAAYSWSSTGKHIHRHTHNNDTTTQGQLEPYKMQLSSQVLPQQCTHSILGRIYQTWNFSRSPCACLRLKEHLAYWQYIVRSGLVGWLRVGKLFSGPLVWVWSCKQSIGALG